jgi:hypothetical protein
MNPLHLVTLAAILKGRNYSESPRLLLLAYDSYTMLKWIPLNPLHTYFLLHFMSLVIPMINMPTLALVPTNNSSSITRFLLINHPPPALPTLHHPLLPQPIATKPSLLTFLQLLVLILPLTLFLILAQWPNKLYLPAARTTSAMVPLIPKAVFPLSLPSLLLVP